VSLARQITSGKTRPSGAGLPNSQVPPIDAREAEHHHCPNVGFGVFPDSHALPKRRPIARAQDEELRMALFLSVLSIACFVGAAISFFRYDSKYFDLLVLSGVIFIGTAIPSFEVDSSLEKLDSINRNLVNIQKAIENLQRN
jgi:hypothetical protein